ncbi:PREDICTED: uncharacterized protein LOC107328454, partial [Acropora digitifera]
DHEKKSDGMRVHHEKRHHERKSNGVRVDHEKK